jgi:hypothetical protein
MEHPVNPFHRVADQAEVSTCKQQHFSRLAR